MRQAAGEEIGASIVELASHEIPGPARSRSSSLVTIWIVALVAIAGLAIAGHVVEPSPPDCCVVGAAASSAPDHVALPLKPAPITVPAMVAAAIDVERDAEGQPLRLAVDGRVDGPVGRVEVRLEAGHVLVDAVTRHFAPIDGRPPAPSATFSMTFDVPAAASLGDLWLTVQADVDGHVVGSLRVPVDGRARRILASTLVGRSRVEIEGIVWSGSRLLTTAPIAGSTRAGGLGGFSWLTDPSAR